MLSVFYLLRRKQLCLSLAAAVVGLLSALTSAEPLRPSLATPYVLGNESIHPSPMTMLFSPPSQPLKSSTPVAEGIGSLVYLASVGGIAFDQVATPVGQVKDLQLRYVPTNRDGRRLAVRVNGQALTTESLPDWQLVPIARFAHSPYFAAVTLFGDLGAAPRPANAKYVVSCHPDLTDTLLGLRLFQADLYILDPAIASELPRTRSGYLLGAGEQPPAPVLSEQTRAWISEFPGRVPSYRNVPGQQPSSAVLSEQAKARLARILESSPHFQSYLICDYKRPVRFGLGRNGLELDGRPYFYFWAGDNIPTQITVINGQPVLPPGASIQHLADLSREVSDDMIDASPHTVPLLSALNPPVYDALLKTMRYAAFFRFHKQHWPDDWDKFIASLAKVRLTPEARTPSIVVEARRADTPVLRTPGGRPGPAARPRH